jgi:hypothetical protein
MSIVPKKIDPKVDDVLRLREQITKQFGLDIYRPG